MIFFPLESFTPPSSWMKHDVAPLDQSLTLKIYLVQNQSLLEDSLLAVSDPYSDSYGRHLLIDEVHALTAPAADSLAALNSWLTSHGFDAAETLWSPSRNSVKVNTTMSKAQEMLNTVRFFSL